MKASTFGSLTGIFVICFACATHASAQTVDHAQTGSAAVATDVGEAALLRSLLAEMRQLRLTLQRTTAATYRFQLILDRMRLQQGRVDMLTRDLEGARLQLANAQFAQTQYAARAKETEEQLGQEQDAKRHAILEQQLKEFKRLAGVQAQQEERFREREAQLTAQLQTEQLKLDGLNTQLDNLEQILTARAQEP
ncbi:MAG: hypothetical protein ACJ74W_13910 [Pyrinomonadaceae bacterium]